ncbi:MAG: glucokinase [Firmicutes bacterium HGW-Firmicutes-21]|nr:MAG: glucokinase [Firmicutes bacterium HGW-Firmicutes-21]
MRIGIDLGGTSVAVGLVDDNYSVLCRTSQRTAGCKDEKELMDRIISCIYDLIKKSGVSTDDIESIGIGCPGSTNVEQGLVVRSGNLPFKNTRVAKILSDEFGKKVYLDNDANCAAWGEYNAGIAKGLDNVVMVTLGTGIGGGIIINGRILHGKENHAGEIGHVVIDINGKRCACGRIGCWETVASTRALIERVRAEAEHVPFSVLGNVISENNGVIDGRSLFIALKRGCKVSKSIFAEYIELLGVGVMNVIEVLRPDMVVFGGGISKEGDTLIAPLRENIGETPTRLEASSLNDNAGIIGAALLHLI